MKLRRVLAAALCTACLTTLPAHAAGSRYLDVVGDEWFAPAVEEMARRGLMDGVGDGNFGPYVALNRAAVIVVLWRLAGSPDVQVEDPFPDTVDTWYADAAAWAKKTAVAGGYDDGSFGGEDLVTREQLAVFLHRYALSTGAPVAEGALGLFSDAGEVSDWAEDAVRHAVGAGLLQGDEGKLHPQLTANRAALAVILQRMLTPAAG